MTVYEHRAHYYETDQMGVVHHSNFIRWMEEVRVVMMEELGFGYKRMEECGVVSPVITINCNYKKMVHFDDVVCIKAKIENYNRVKLTVRYEMYDKATNELRAEGYSVHCFLDKNGRPVRMSKYCPEFEQALFRELKLQQDEQISDNKTD